VKRNPWLVGAVVTIAIIVACVAARGLAQQPQAYGQQPQAYGQQPQQNYGSQQYYSSQQRPAVQSRIAVMNLGQVIKGYRKYQSFEAEMKQQSTVLQQELEKKKASGVAMQKQLEQPGLAPDQREQLERDIKRLQREMQDSVEEAKARIAKREVDQLVVIYKDIKDAVDAYARTYGFEMVMQYTDAIGPDAYAPQNFSHKMTNRACMPIYVDQRLDITAEITQMLNNKVASAMPVGNQPR
jgi:Skp family chaperone for outer membrane proteins